jgi:hypothetical protein
MKRAALAVTLLACGHRSPPPPPPPLTIPSLPPAPVLAPPASVHACVPAAPPPGRFLSVRTRYAVGEGARVAAACDRLSVFTERGGLRLFDPATGIMTPRLPDGSDELLSTGAIGLWSDAHLAAVDRIDLKTRWKVPRSGRGRVYAAGPLFIEEAGRACEPTCAVIAHDAMTGEETWRRACPCHEKGLKLAELYESMSAVDGKIIATELEKYVEAWDPKDGHTIWSRPDEHAVVLGRFVVLDRAAPQAVTVLDGNGKELTRVSAAQPRIEAMAADAETLFIASSDAPEYGGVTNDVIEGFEIPSGKRVWSTTLKSVVRRYASTPPSLWAAPGAPIYFFEIDNGFLTTIDRSGHVLSSIGVAGLAPVRTQTGFAAVDAEGVVEVLEPSESAVAASVRVEGTLTLDGKPMPNIEIVVGDVRTKTGIGGRYSATLSARGRFWVKPKQPTAPNSTAYWANADAVVDVDGRTGSYVVNLEAKRDTLE